MSAAFSSPFAYVDGKPLDDFDRLGGSGQAQIDAIGSGVIAADLSANGKLLVRGGGAEEILEAAGVGRIEIGHGIAVEDSMVYRLRQDLYFLSAFPGRSTEAADTLTSMLTRMAVERDVFVTVTDVTHGRSEMWLVGLASRALMSKLCGLDFSERAFPDAHAKQTSFAKTKQLIIRRDAAGQPAFAVIGGRSFASYVWETTLEAGEEFGITPIGADALRAWVVND